MARLASFIRQDHRYVLLGTAVVAAIGMRLSSSPRPVLSFMRYAYPVEVVMYALLAAWLVLAAVGLVLKLTHWDTYAETSPLASPAGRRALRLASYVVWAIVAVLVVDRIVMGVATAWNVAVHASSRPANDTLQSILYILYQGRDTFVTGLVTTVELAVIGTLVAFVLALLLVFFRIQTIDRPDNDFVRFWKKVGSGFARVYSLVVRGTPMMVQAMIIYFGVFGLLRATNMSTTQINGIWSTFLAGRDLRRAQARPHARVPESLPRRPRRSRRVAGRRLGTWASAILCRGPLAGPPLMRASLLRARPIRSRACKLCGTHLRLARHGAFAARYTRKHSSACKLFSPLEQPARGGAFATY